MTADRTLTSGDLIAGTAIAALMTAGCVMLSPGLALIVTFVPGIAVSWGLFAWMYRQRLPLPRGAAFLPLYFGLLVWQLLHFGEELMTGFPSRFPALYGGEPFTAEEFVLLNLAAYLIFSVAAVLALVRNVRFLIVPALFFVVYGGIGNAIAHTWWTVYLQGYFPGFYTALVYWVAAPFVLSRLLGGDRRAVLVVLVTLALALVPLLTVFARAI